MPLQIKNLALAAALALGGVTATDVVPVLQAQAENEVQRDAGEVKFLRAAALQGRELQREADAASVECKTYDKEDGDHCSRYDTENCCESNCLFLSEVSKQGFCGYALRGEMCGDRLPCRPGDLCLPPEAGSSAEVCVDPDEHVARLDREHRARVEEFMVALLKQLEQPDTEVPRFPELINQLDQYQFIDLIRHSGGPWKAALLGARTDASDVINQLSRNEFLELILRSDERGRAALTGARTHYYGMFANEDLNNIPLDADNGVTTASDLHISDWQIPDNANVYGMFLTGNGGGDTQSRLDMTEEECPCINGKQCCPCAFNHGCHCQWVDTECSL